MEAVELEQPLQEEALREIERSLYGKLRAHRISDTFIDRCGEDAIQKGLLAYLRARQAGEHIENRDAFVVRAAFCRAIDELRREARQADGEAVEGLLRAGRGATPASEELALEQIEAQELHAAIEELSPDERQVLVLHYFERLSAKRSAELLYCSEATYRRRLKRALAALAERLGVTPPETDSEFAFEIALAAWASLGGARVALARGPLEHLAAVLDRGRDATSWLGARIRYPLARAEASGASEQAGAIASGPAGKVIGGCAAAAIACVVGGVVGPGIADHGRASPSRVDPRAAISRHATPKPLQVQPPAVAPVALGRSATGQSQPPPEASSPRPRPKQHKTEQQRVEEQTSGFARAEAESTSQPEAEASTAEAETVTVAPSGGGGTSSPAAAEKEFGFEGQP